MKNNLLRVKSNISLIKSLSDEEFIKKLNLLSGGTKLQVDDMVLQIFEYFGYSSQERFQEFLAQEELPQDRLELLVRQFQTWKMNSGFMGKAETSEREKIKDLQWKLAVKAGGLDQSSESIYVQIQLVVECDQHLRRHHLRMDVDTFYDFLDKLEKGIANVREILHP